MQEPFQIQTRSTLLGFTSFSKLQSPQRLQRSSHQVPPINQELAPYLGLPLNISVVSPRKREKRKHGNLFRSSRAGQPRNSHSFQWNLHEGKGADRNFRKVRPEVLEGNTNSVPGPRRRLTMAKRRRVGLPRISISGLFLLYQNSWLTLKGEQQLIC